MHVLEVESPLGAAILQDTRLRILALLAGPDATERDGLTLQEIGSILKCSPQNVHHHLRILSDVAAVRVARSEATQRIPRQFWISDVRRIVLRFGGTGELEVDMGLPRRVRTTLERDLARWSERHGGDGSVAALLRTAEFLGSLEGEGLEEAMEILRSRLPKT